MVSLVEQSEFLDEFLERWLSGRKHVLAKDATG